VSRWERGSGVLHVEIELPGTVVDAWNVHLQKSLESTGIQYRTIDHLVAQVQRADGPVLVAGDFNATTINYPCVKMNQYLDDAFEQVGFGFGFTFPSPARRMGMITPFMRIDHIYYSKHFVVRKAYVVDDAGGSDHYPVVALMSLKDTAASSVQ
jgi:endonuclease/exonuclease/phosphatase family metal-dependent hydrolase